MAITCSKGHVNDDANRFCDQCGEPLQPSAASAAPAAAATSAPAPAGAAATNIACPVCGQENVPGTAFCDNCGAPLPPPQPVADLGPAADESVSTGDAIDANAAPTSTSTITCAQCGAVNDASNRFCDNCGAELAAAPSGAPLEPEPVAPVEVTAPAEVAAPADAGTAGGFAAAGTLIDQALPPVAADSPSAPIDGTASAPIDTADSTPVDTTASAPVETVDSSAAVPSPAVDVAAERQRLQEQIATQGKVVEQLEQLEASFGAATPAAVRQGLEEARTNLAQAEQALAALPPEGPPVDPAEVARLEEQIATQRKVVEQLEQMEASLGAATPAAIRQGLEEARANLAQAEQALTDLTGSAAPAHPLPSALDVATQRAEEQAQPATTPASAPEPAQAAAAPAEASAPALVPAPTPVAAAPAPTPAAAPQVGTDQLPPAPQQPSGPRLVTRDGKSIALPRSGGDLIIGREDPISGIHPQIDLTPFGGEAGGVSRRHAMIREQGGQWVLTDLDSTNYTRVDGNRLAPNTPTPLHEGARLQFGRVDFEFHAA